MKALLFDIKGTGESRVVEIKDKLEDYYRELDCDTIDIVDAQLGDKVFSVVLDDNGLFQENATVSAYYENQEPRFVGNLLICNSCGPNLVGLTDSDIKYIQDRFIASAVSLETGRVFDVLIISR